MAKFSERLLCFMQVRDNSGKAGKATVALKGFLIQPAGLVEEEPAGSSINKHEGTDRQLSNVTGLQLTILSANSGMKNVLLPWRPKGNYYCDSSDSLLLKKYKLYLTLTLKRKTYDRNDQHYCAVL